MINYMGLVAAVSTFFGIWYGHVFVRKMEAKIEHLKPLIFSCIVIGLGLEMVSIVASKNLVSAVLGIVGITVLWDALEFIRQEKRVKKGHAPANPDNPRHARILAEYQQATKVNLLNRTPREKPYSIAEFNAILQTDTMEKP